MIDRLPLARIPLARILLARVAGGLSAPLAAIAGQLQPPPEGILTKMKGAVG